MLLDQPGVPNYSKPGRLLVGGLVKLRDLEDNIWNTDTLFILTDTAAHAQELARVFDEADLGAMPRVFDLSEETDMALGTGRREYGLLTVWWD